MKTTEVRNRLQQMMGYVDGWIDEKGDIELEEGSFEEDVLCTDLRNLSFEIKYK